MAELAWGSLAADSELLDHVSVYGDEQNDRESAVERAAVRGLRRSAADDHLADHEQSPSAEFPQSQSQHAIVWFRRSFERSYLEHDFLPSITSISDVMKNLRILVAPNQPSSRFFDVAYIKSLRSTYLY